MVTKNYDHLPIDQRPRHEVEGQSCRCNQAGCPVCNVPRNPLLPESDYILAKLCVAILPRSSLSSELPDREDLDELCFLRELAELCYVSERHDLGQIFFEYFCIDPRGPLLAPLIDRYPMAEDIIAETLESIYSDIVADPETHEPRGAAEFGIGDQPKPINSPHPFDPHASILERVFRSVFPAAVVEAEFDTDGDVWRMHVDAEVWEFPITSDDDALEFTHKLHYHDGKTSIERLTFPFPTDWKV